MWWITIQTATSWMSLMFIPVPSGDRFTGRYSRGNPSTWAGALTPWCGSAAFPRWFHMPWNHRGNAAEPHHGVRAPAQVDGLPREYLPVKRSPDGTGINIRLIQDVAVWIVIHHIKERTEIVYRQVDVEYQDGPLRAEASPQGLNCNSHRRQRVLAL